MASSVPYDPYIPQQQTAAPTGNAKTQDIQNVSIFFLLFVYLFFFS